MRRECFALESRKPAWLASPKCDKPDRNTAAVCIRKEIAFCVAAASYAVVGRPLRLEPSLQRGQQMPLPCQMVNGNCYHASALTLL
jgi:hypothetical protein